MDLYSALRYFSFTPHEVQLKVQILRENTEGENEINDIKINKIVAPVTETMSYM